MRIDPDISSALRLMVRARFVTISVVVLILTLAFALLSAMFSGRQPATVALDVGLSIIRICLPFIGMLFVLELISREFDRRFFLTSLTYPRPRSRLLLGRLIALGGMLTVLLALLAVVLAGLVVFVGNGYEQATPVSLRLPYLITILFILVDVFVVLSLSALLAVVASTPSFVLVGTIGFALISRSFSTVVELLQRESWLVEKSEGYRSSIELLRLFVPDLAALDVRMIALYGRLELLPQNWLVHVGSAIAYGIALIGVAVWALNHKRFT